MALHLFGKHQHVFSIIWKKWSKVKSSLDLEIPGHLADKFLRVTWEMCFDATLKLPLYAFYCHPTRVMPSAFRSSANIGAFF